MIMTQALFFKNLPAPLQFWIRPMLLASLGLHGLFLSLPMQSAQKNAPPKKEPDKVKITQLPIKTNSPAPKISPLATPKPAAIVPQAKPSPAVSKPITPQPKPIRQSVTTPPPSPISSITRPQPQPTSTPTPAQPTPTPSTTLASSPTPTPTPAPSPASSPTPPSQDPFADFPIYPNAKPGSSGLLTGEADQAARTVKADLATVMAYYKAELPNKKFDTKSTTEETDLKVSQVSKGGVSQYLHLKNAGENTIIVLAPQPLDLKNLGNLEVEPPEAREFQTILGQLVNVDLLPAISLGDLQDASAFQGGNVKSILGEFKEVTPQALGASLEQGLRAAQFEVSPISTSFGGGVLYQVKKGAYVGYLSLAPTKTPGRTGILTLKNSPIQ